MRSWPALILAPLVALTDLSILYALVTPSCGRQDRAGLHAVAALSLLIVIVLTLVAWRAWQRESNRSAAKTAVTASDDSAAARRPGFIDLVAMLVGALSLLVCVALWLPVWLLSPCY